jgi:hypothetical protein
MAKEKSIIQQIKGKEVEVDRAHLEERFTSDRQVLNWNPQGQHKRGRPLRELGEEL